MFRAALSHCGLDITYDPWETPPEGLGGFVEWARRPDSGVAGFNVTVPHKEAVAAAVDEASQEAERAGAVNTVVVRDGRLHGHNTDGIGFVLALKEEANFTFDGRRVLILGAGGAARGVVMALAAENPESVVIANRTPERAQRLAQDLRRRWRGVVDTASLGGEGLGRAAEKSDLIVQCSTVGMSHGPDPAGSLLRSEDIPGEALVYDLVYNPPETPLMKEARKAGARVLGGLSMLVYQGAEGFEAWTGEKAPVKVMFRAASDALDRARR